MDLARLETLIEAAFDDRDNINANTQGEVREAVEATLEALDNGSLRVAERQDVGKWKVNQWAKKAVLLGFRLNDMEVMDGACGGAPGWDKVKLKTDGWGENRFREAGFRAVPGSVVRHSAHRQGRGAHAVFREPRRVC